jgi:hypothetical protein
MFHIIQVLRSLKLKLDLIILTAHTKLAYGSEIKKKIRKSKRKGLKLTLAVERKRSFLLQRTKLNVARFYV